MGKRRVFGQISGANCDERLFVLATTEVRLTLCQIRLNPTRSIALINIHSSVIKVMNILRTTFKSVIFKAVIY